MHNLFAEFSTTGEESEERMQHLPMGLLDAVSEVGHVIDVSWSDYLLSSYDTHHLTTQLLLHLRILGQAVQTPHQRQ